MRDIFVKNLFNKMKNDPSVILLTADLGFGVFDCFEEFRNKQYFNVGVSEQLMASMAAGLSLEGFNVYIYSIGVFPTFRCLEQIRNDISYHDCTVTIITTGAGFSYGALGMTHHCVQDIGIMSSVPNINIFSPSNKFEMEEIFNFKCGIRYIRLDKSELNLLPKNHNQKKYHYYCYFENNKFNKEEKNLILSHGSIGSIAQPFFSDKYKIDFYTVPYLRESKELVNLLKDYKKIITIEEHSIKNGFYSFIVDSMAKNKIFSEIDYLGLEHQHISLVGDQKYLRDKFSLNQESILKKIKC